MLWALMSSATVRTRLEILMNAAPISHHHQHEEIAYDLRVLLDFNLDQGASKCVGHVDVFKLEC